MQNERLKSSLFINLQFQGQSTLLIIIIYSSIFRRFWSRYYTHAQYFMSAPKKKKIMDQDQTRPNWTSLINKIKKKKKKVRSVISLISFIKYFYFFILFKVCDRYGFFNSKSQPLRIIANLQKMLEVFFYYYFFFKE